MTEMSDPFEFIRKCNFVSAEMKPLLLVSGRDPDVMQRTMNHLASVNNKMDTESRDDWHKGIIAQMEQISSQIQITGPHFVSKLFNVLTYTSRLRY